MQQPKLAGSRWSVRVDLRLDEIRIEAVADAGENAGIDHVEVDLVTVK